MTEQTLVIGGILYELIVRSIYKDAIVENISGHSYISHNELRRVLGRKCRVPYDCQMRVVKELMTLGVIEINSNPECLFRRMSTGEIFYKLKKEIDKE